MAGSISKANGRQSQKRKNKFPKYSATRTHKLHMYCPKCDRQYEFPSQEAYRQGGHTCKNGCMLNDKYIKLQMRHDLNAVVRTPIAPKK